MTDKGENLVYHLGLQTVPTHVLVDSAGQVRTKPSPLPLLPLDGVPSPLKVKAQNFLPPCQHYDTGIACKLVEGLLSRLETREPHTPHGLLQLVSVLARKQLPDGPTVEALVNNADGGRA